MTHLQGFSIRSYIPIMETPPIDSKLFYELKVGFHCIENYATINISFNSNSITQKHPQEKEQRTFLLLLLAIATELVPSSHGQTFVGAPNGSPPVPRNVCQNATLNLIQSYCWQNLQSTTISYLKKSINTEQLPTFIFFPRISSSPLYHLNARGFLLEGP